MISTIMNMVSVFDAPCLILACISRDNLVEYQMLDIGLIAQTICLAAHDKGLGTCCWPRPRVSPPKSEK